MGSELGLGWAGFICALALGLLGWPGLVGYWAAQVSLGCSYFGFLG